jgi:hypothetical protein
MLLDADGYIRQGALQRPSTGFHSVSLNVRFCGVAAVTCEDLSRAGAFNGSFISSYAYAGAVKSQKPCGPVGEHRLDHYRINRNLIEMEWRGDG